MTNTFLKLLAMLFMIIDHIGAVLLIGTAYQDWYMLTRILGRLAFPIFVFLLVEGFVHTSNKKKYLYRLLIFSVISEIPFNLASHGEVFNPEYQNVFFTLALGLMMIWGFDYNDKKTTGIKHKLLHFTCFMFFTLLSIFMLVDYSFVGLILIAIVYKFRGQLNKQAIAIAFFVFYQTSLIGPATELFMGLMMLFGLATWWLVKQYNGELGRNSRYLYWVYPVHLLLFWGIRYLLIL